MAKGTNEEMQMGSNQFLFDSQRSGRALFPVKDKKPKVKWEFCVRSHPKKGPESAPVFDIDGNIYFGCHDGSIYSIDSKGKLRWIFNTDKKVYSSPLITKEQEIVIISGNGFAYKFNKYGELQWVYDTSVGYREKTLKHILNRLMYIHKSFDYKQKKLWNIRSWSSPNMCSKNIVYLTGYGIGLHAVDLYSGDIVWTYDLGSPRFHLAGVVLDKEENIYACSQQTYIHCLNPEGKLIWKTKLKHNYDIWGNPSIDPESGIIYVSCSYGERKAIVYALSPNGEKVWSSKVDGAIRGSIAISYENYVVVGTFSGYIYFLDKLTGDIIYRKKFSNADRALWTTPCIDPNGKIIFTTKDSFKEGSIICLDKNGNLIWKLEDIGKSLSVPVIDREGNIYIGSWKGKFICLG